MAERQVRIGGRERGRTGGRRRRGRRKERKVGGRERGNSGQQR